MSASVRECAFARVRVSVCVCWRVRGPESYINADADALARASDGCGGRAVCAGFGVRLAAWRRDARALLGMASRQLGSSAQ